MKIFSRFYKNNSAPSNLATDDNKIVFYNFKDFLTTRVMSFITLISTELL
jgi:hypothetical protein